MNSTLLEDKNIREVSGEVQHPNNCIKNFDTLKQALDFCYAFDISDHVMVSGYIDGRRVVQVQYDKELK